MSIKESVIVKIECGCPCSNCFHSTTLHKFPVEAYYGENFHYCDYCGDFVPVKHYELNCPDYTVVGPGSSFIFKAVGFFGDYIIKIINFFKGRV
jgi:hypothetical protein